MIVNNDHTRPEKLPQTTVGILSLNNHRGNTSTLLDSYRVKSLNRVRWVLLDLDLKFGSNRPKSGSNSTPNFLYPGHMGSRVLSRIGMTHESFTVDLLTGTNDSPQKLLL